MRQIIVLALLFKLVLMIEDYREQVRKHFTQKQTVLQLDFKTPKLGFLPFERKDSVIWSVYHLYIFYKRISHIHHHGRYGVNFIYKQEIHQSFTETWTWCTNTAIITTETSALRAALLIQNANGDFVFVMKVQSLYKENKGQDSCD